MPDAPETNAPNDYQAERCRKRDELVAMGENPYGGRVRDVEPLANVRDAFQVGMDHATDDAIRFTVAGRVVLKRDMGKLSFLTLRDDTGDLQVALQKNALTDQEWEVRNRIDLGDQIVVSGPLGSTKTGEPTVWAGTLSMSSKSLVVPPDKHKGLEDVELRYRQRYVDLWANPDVMRTMKLRGQIVARMRQYLVDKGYLEVETPMLQSLQGGAAARPFTTKHNALDIPLFLRIAPELYLKRLLVGGFRKVFEINRNFRNEGVSPRHNPEFTMLEAYEAYGNYETMMEMVEEMVCTVAQDVFRTLQIVHHEEHEGDTKPEAEPEDTEEETQMSREGSERSNGRIINLRRPWRRVRMDVLVEERTGWKFDRQKQLQEADPLLYEAMTYEEIEPFRERLADVQKKFQHVEQASIAGSVNSYMKALVESAKRELEGIKADFGKFEADVTSAYGKLLALKSPAEQLVEVYEKLVEPTLIDPTFVTHVPSVIIPLARPSEEDPYFAEVYELAINGQEISPGYTELNDPDVQERLFRQQVGDEAERQDIDQDFLNALKVGMPPAGGMGLGVDRLVMLLTGAESIRDVLLFPLMRPK